MKFAPKYPVVSLLLTSQLVLTIPTFGQSNINREKFNTELEHGIKQYEDGHYVQAIHTLEHFLATHRLPLYPNINHQAPQLELELARYYIVLSRIKYGSDDLEEAATKYLSESVNPVHRDRAAFLLAQHYFRKGDYNNALTYYEQIDIHNLNNEEIADAKFEQAYSYFVQSDFEKAYPLFAAIKEIKNHKYYNAGNYYYGLLAYNRKMYDAALASFKRIEDLPEYKDIVPYYIAEVYYFKGEYDKVLNIADKYLYKEPKLYYEKELHLLVGQIYFERKQYEKALPYLNYYYKNAEKIRKENLYELAFTNYQLGNYKDAIAQFKPLSNTQDSMSQNSMYLMGDAYLKTGDKEGARNAFSIAAGMDFLPSVKENAHFLYAKLSYELGDESLASQSFRNFIDKYPNSKLTPEAKEKLVQLLSKSKDYHSAYQILSGIPINTATLRQIYQKVSMAYGLQLLNKGDYNEAERLLDESISYPADAAVLGVAHFWKAQIAFDKKNFDKSAEHIEQFITLAKTHGKEMRRINAEANLANAYNHLGYTRMELKQYDAAQKAFALAGNVPASEAGSQMVSKQNTLLQADAAFMNKKYNDAAALYEKVIVANGDDAAYAMYQKALIAGLTGHNPEKITLLNKVIKNYNDIRIKEMAFNELGNTYIEQEKWTEARSQYELLSNSTKDKNLRAIAVYKIAYTYQKSGNHKEAAKFYEQFILDYPNHPDRKTALESLQTTYLALENVDGYYAFVQKHNIDSDLASSKDQDYFEIAENKYNDEKYSEAITAFDQYLKQFPEGKYTIQAKYLKGESLTALKKYQEANKAYNEVLQSNNNEFVPLALLRLAQNAYELKEYNQSVQHIEAFLDHATEDETKIIGHIVRMKAYNKLGNIADAGVSAVFLEPYATELNPADQNELESLLAHKLFEEASYAEAQKKYQALAQGKTTVAAEARYRLAQILLKQGKLQEAEAACDIAIKANEYDYYWMVKSYILIGEILAAQKDYFNARATLQSVVDNATIKELANEAAELLKKVNEQEKQNSKLESGN